MTQETHYVCDVRLKEKGGKAICCACDPHENCVLSASKEWERNYRSDKGIWEDTCPHGIGHDKGVHGCDGCCKGLYTD